MKTALVVALSGLFALASIQAADKAEKKMWAQSYLGRKAPELVVEKWLSKEPDRKGKFVLIDFWATWCGDRKSVV